MSKPPTIQTVKRELDQFRKQLRPSRSRPKPSTGDVLGIKRNLHGLKYEHYGIYSGQGKVIHYTGSHSGLGFRPENNGNLIQPFYEIG